MTKPSAWTEDEVMAQIARTQTLSQDSPDAIAHFSHFGASCKLQDVSQDLDACLQDAWLSQMAQFDVNENGI